LQPAADRVTSKLAALHFYPLAIPAPTPLEDSFDAAAAKQSALVLGGKEQMRQLSRRHLGPTPIE
jgi:hypothetical protein